MLTFLPQPVLASIMLVLLCVNTVFWSIPVYACILVKLLTPEGSRARDAVSKLAAEFAQTWAVINVWMCDHFLVLDFDVRIDAPLSRKGQYLVCANHQTWNDIFVVMKTFGRRAPFFKFFIKQQLIWVPVLGGVWWGLDFPFMKRHTPEQIAKNPALKGQDLETTRRACARYRNQPVMILNFLEGTRFTPAKHDKQQSPYRHLLKPRAGGFAFTLGALGERLNSLLDVTIVYPEGAKGFWQFLGGRVRRVRVDVRQLTIPKEFYAGSYENDPAFRERFRGWIEQLWADKDRRMEEMLGKPGT
jgi:1-acyl-sn-glycerol-3-phosphate acyltransferase